MSPKPLIVADVAEKPQQLPPGEIARRRAEIIRRFAVLLVAAQDRQDAEEHAAAQGIHAE